MCWGRWCCVRLVVGLGLDWGLLRRREERRGGWVELVLTFVGGHFGESEMGEVR